MDMVVYGGCVVMCFDWKEERKNEHDVDGRVTQCVYMCMCIGACKRDDRKGQGGACVWRVQIYNYQEEITLNHELNEDGGTLL